MGYAVYEIGNHRWGGYGVPAICEYPTCNEEIDRGMGYACGGEPFSEHGCDLYFCSKHTESIIINPATGKQCRHQKDCDCDCDLIGVCERCAKRKPSFPYKPERKEWLEHLLNDESWQKWRDTNPGEVEWVKEQLNKK